MALVLWRDLFSPVQFHRCACWKWNEWVGAHWPLLSAWQKPLLAVSGGHSLSASLPFCTLSGSECCVRTQPTRTWARRWRTSAAWSTATCGTCTPLLMTRPWWVHSSLQRPFYGDSKICINSKSGIWIKGRKKSVPYLCTCFKVKNLVKFFFTESGQLRQLRGITQPNCSCQACVFSPPLNCWNFQGRFATFANATCFCKNTIAAANLVGNWPQTSISRKTIFPISKTLFSNICLAATSWDNTVLGYACFYV